jgi:hypothetical protein
VTNPTLLRNASRILGDMENLFMKPADVARNARRLRGIIEELTGEELPEVEVI